MVEYLFGDLIRKGNEACIDGRIAFVFGVCDIVVELHNLLEEHEDIIRLLFLVACYRNLSCGCSFVGVADIQVLLHEGELVDEGSFFDVVEIWEEGIADDRDNVVLEAVDHHSIFHVAHVVVDHLHCVDERLEQVQFKEVGGEIVQKDMQLFRCLWVLVEYLKEDA